MLLFAVNVDKPLDSEKTSKGMHSLEAISLACDVFELLDIIGYLKLLQTRIQIKVI